jgi:serine/threonine-protein kinase RsbW
MESDGDAVRLSLPADVRYLRLARLTAAGLAGDLGFDVREIEDLRIAVDEACAVLLDAPLAPGTSLDLVYRADDGEVSIEGSCAGDGSRVPEVHPVARELLKMSTDEHDIVAEGGLWRFRLVKRGSTAS